MKEMTWSPRLVLGLPKTGDSSTLYSSPYVRQAVVVLPGHKI